jgi:Ca-activated chloride channel family protein
MIELALPWALAALPLPLLAWWLLPPAPERGGALRVPFFRSLAAQAPGGLGASRRGAVAALLKALAWLLLVVAAAQPQWAGPAREVATRGRDLMLALDLSGSMGTPDFEINGRSADRFSAVREVARHFALDRKGDRVGLVLFGTRAFLQAPLTPDLPTVAELLDESEVGLAGEQTAIGDAIGLAVKHLRDRPAQRRVLVLLSDGESNAGVLEPRKAAELARDAGVRIYAIGVGGGRRTLATLLGARVVRGPSELDEPALREIADLTGGSYFRADDVESLVRVYREIDALEPTEGAAATVRPVHALFPWPLGGAIAIAGLLGLASAGREAASLSAARAGGSERPRIAA